MIRKLFWIVLLVIGYLWVMSSDKDKDIAQNLKRAYEFIVNKAEKSDIEIHIHSLECFQKKKNHK